MFKLDFAQTNLQLLNQLKKDEYSAESVELIASAYKLAKKFFPTQFRPNGKTLLAHVIGVASILVNSKAPDTIVAAAVLHAAYAAAELGADDLGPIDEMRAPLLKAAVGDTVELYVHTYTPLKWNAESIAEYLDQFDSMGHAMHAAIAIRLANEVEEYMDNGLHHLPEDRRNHLIDRYEKSGSAMIELADKLGYANLTRDLKEIPPYVISTYSSSGLVAK